MHPVRRLGAALALTLVVPAAAQAQFGGLIKKAKEKVEQAGAAKVAGDNAASQPSCGITTTYDATTIELNAANLDKVIKGMTAVRTAGDKNGRNKLAAQRDGDRARLEELESDPALQEAENSQREYASCRNEAFQAIVSKRVEEKGSGIMADYMKAMREHNERIQAYEAKGDTAHAKALQDSTWTVMSKVVTPTAQDSAQVAAKCGKPPRASKRVAERDSLRRVVREESDSIRVLDEDAEDAVRGASGLNARQMAAARERIEAFVRSGRTCGYSKAEIDALTARKSELEKLL
jgi:hypothetical protein